MSPYGPKLPPVPQEVVDLVDKRFCDPERHGYGNYGRNDSGEQIVEHTLYSFVLRSTTHLVRLQLFRGLEGLGGELWSREIRTLQRMSSMRTHGVPEIVDGGVTEDDFAFVLTRSSSQTLATDDVLDRIRSRPIEALSHFGVLADALSLMHEHSLAHRNLWHGVIEYDDGGNTPEVRLSRFEMSALVTNLLLLEAAQVGETDVYTQDRVRRALLAQSGEALACFAPERLEAFAGDNPDGGSVETERSDVYGLGVIAWQMFVGPLPKAAHALLPPGGGVDLEAAKELHKSYQSELRSADLPVDIKGLLQEMLSYRWQDRPSSLEVCTDLTTNYKRIVRGWMPKTHGKAHRVVFIPRDMVEAVSYYRWLDTEPGEDLWTEELCDLIADDVNGGEIVFSPLGYPGRDTDTARAAKYVLIGDKAVWYCTLFRDTFGRGSERPELLLVRYVEKKESLHANQARRLKPQGSCPEVVVSPVVHGVTAMAVNGIVEDRPSWIPLFEPLKRPSEQHGNRELFRQTLDFLVDYQDALLLARYYAYKRVTPPDQTAGQSNVITLRFDAERDRRMRDLYGKERRLHAHIGVYNGAFRPTFGRFFTSEATYDGAWEVVISRDSDGAPESRATAVGIVRRSSHPEEITIEFNNERSYIPEHGWLRPAGDFANAVNLNRQRTAKEEFLRLGKMLDRLLTPVGVAWPVSHWKDEGRNLRYPKDDPLPPARPVPHEKRDDNQRFLIDMLRLAPLYMLMGPPGTGKTTTVAAAVAAFLRKNPGTRVLLSAQSHFALDNLGEKLAESLDAKTVVIRVTTRDSEGRVAQKMRKYLPSDQARQTILSIKSQAPAALKKYRDAITPETRGAIEEWLSRVDASQAELAERLVRGASVVLATTSASTPDTLGYGARVGVFDWVVVEEVAKAWITEIAIPLARGYRWALVGDPEQLPAHRREDVDRLLLDLGQERFKDVPELSKYGENRERMEKVFDFFKRAFSPDTDQRPPRRGMVPATGRLVRQFRMRKPIGDLVSEAFYKRDAGSGGSNRGLETPPEAERPARLKRPEVLADDAPLVWMDTSKLTDCHEQPFWRNRGEALLIRDMLSELEPWPTPSAPNDGPESIAVLTPYNQQRNDLSELIAKDVLAPRSVLDPRVPAPGPDTTIVHNVHTVQGREYDIGIVSLVRTGQYASPTSTGLGFLEWPYLINVLFSRARRQLIVFGNFEYYSSVEIAHWKKICEHFEKNGKIVRLGLLSVGEGG